MKLNFIPHPEEVQQVHIDLNDFEESDHHFLITLQNEILKCYKVLTACRKILDSYENKKFRSEK